MTIQSFSCQSNYNVGSNFLSVIFKLVYRGRSIRRAMKWVIGGAVAAGGGWLFGLVLARLALAFAILTAPLAGRLSETVVVMVAIGGGYGLLVGIAAGFSPHRSLWRVSRIAWVVVLTITGVIGGGLSPLMVVATEGILPPPASSTLAWGVAGGLGGLMAYLWPRR